MIFVILWLYIYVIKIGCFGKAVPKERNAYQINVLILLLCTTIMDRNLNPSRNFRGVLTDCVRVGFIMGID